MKRFYISTILLMFLGSFAVAQSLSLSHSGNTINNGDTVMVSDPDANATLDIHLTIQNISSSTINIKAKKTEISLITGSINFFCDWNTCYPPNSYVSLVGLDLTAGNTNSAFIGDYLPSGNPGESIIMYTFFNTDDATDSIAVIVKFIAGVVGIDDAKPSVEISNLFPNPATNKVSVKYNLNGANNAQLEIRNVLGSLVKKVSINESNGLLNVDVSDLTNGVYFYSFIVNNEIIKSKKLIIQR